MSDRCKFQGKLNLAYLPNSISLLRIFLSLVALLLFWVKRFKWALLLVLICVFSDWVDGYLARRFGWITEFGKLIDPIADKVLIIIGFIILALEGILPWLIVIPIAVREIGITVYRIRILRGENVVIPAQRLGKWKTSIEMLTLLIGMYGIWIVRSGVIDDFDWILRLVVGLGYLSLALSLWSGIVIIRGSSYES